MPRHKSSLFELNVSYVIMEENEKQGSGRKEARRETVKDNKKVKKKKKKKYIENAIFCVQYLTVRIVLMERKTSLITVFTQLLQTMTKKT